MQIMDKRRENETYILLHSLVYNKRKGGENETHIIHLYSLVHPAQEINVGHFAGLLVGALSSASQHLARSVLKQPVRVLD